MTMTPSQRRHRELKAKAEAFDKIVAEVAQLKAQLQTFQNLNPEGIQYGDTVGIMHNGFSLFQVTAVAPNGMVQVVQKKRDQWSKFVDWSWHPALSCKKGQSWSDFERHRPIEGLIDINRDRMFRKPEPSKTKWDNFPL